MQSILEPSEDSSSDSRGERPARGRGRGGYRGRRPFNPEARSHQNSSPQIYIKNKRRTNKINLTGINLLMFPKRFEWLLFLKGFSKIGI